uniref:Multiple epidermal growth factor-like domains protein 6 n=1 Tax=Crassostrea virginica TaxID=6565 RepID=A0A8B8AD81_CRAVI|nr:multiple epidermal growth factor-like domains protein 6 [Crassostrea virginica]
MYVVQYPILACVLTCSLGDIGGIRPDYCDKGYFGIFCRDECHYPYYGKLCIKECHCIKELCSFTDGCLAVDNCPDGYTGKLCTATCAYPYYGQACQKRCLCAKDRCHFATGCETTKSIDLVRAGPYRLADPPVIPGEQITSSRLYKVSETKTTTKLDRNATVIPLVIPEENVITTVSYNVSKIKTKGKFFKDKIDTSCFQKKNHN